MPAELAAKAQTFRDLHDQDGIFVMPNAWDACSARLLADLGFPALGTTSAGVAFSMGVPDYQNRIERDTMLDAYRAVVEAVDLPVSGDLEAGYGDDPDAVAATITASIAAGMVGGSIEDHTGDPAAPLYDIDLAVERIQAARHAADAAGIPYVLTARAECFFVGHTDPFAESVTRLNRYHEAGADCLYAPGMRDAETIGALVREVDGPVNVVMGLVGAALSVNELADLGVKRISTGGGIARLAFAAVRRAGAEIAEHGTFTYAGDAIPDAEMMNLFETSK